MKTKISKALLILIAVFLVSGLNAQPGSEEKEEANYVLLKNATIIDAISDNGKIGSILLKDDQIENIDYAKEITPPAGTIVYDLSGKFVIPGIIDGHVHVTHGTTAEAQQHLEFALKNGVTGVRDMGGDGRMLALLKKNMQIGENVGPDIFYSTIIAGTEFFKNDPRPQSVAYGAIAGEVPWQRAITVETDFRQIVAEVKGMGATAIKVYASVEKDLMNSVCAEAKKQGLKIWSHAAIAPMRPSDIINAGSEAVSHAGDFIQYVLADEVLDRYCFESREEAMKYRGDLNKIPWDENTKEVKEIFALMKQNHSILDATLFVYMIGLDSPINGHKIDSSFFKIAMKTTLAAYNAGVKISAGSDHMIEPSTQEINIHKEMELLVEAGLNNIDAIRAATIINAEIVGEEDNIGSVEEGKLANILVLNSNPLEEISNTSDIKYVFKRGKLID